jgi:hypothetical protein
MKITYALTQRDFFDSMIAIRNRKRWAKWVFRASLPVLGLLIVFSLFTSPAPKLMLNLAPLLFFVLLWAFLLWGSPWWLARTQSKQPSVQGQRTASLDSNGVHWQWDGGSSVTEWKTYIRWMETKNEILLCSRYHSKTLFERGTTRGIANAADGEHRCCVKSLAGAAKHYLR